MKHYQITFEVPDDFNPDNMELNAAYGEGTEVSISDEGFVQYARGEQLKELFEKIDDYLDMNLKI